MRKKNALTIVLLLCLVAVILLTFIDYELDLHAKPIAVKFINLFYAIAVAYVTGYQFYFLTVVMKDLEERPKRDKYVSARLGKIIGGGTIIAKELKYYAETHGVSGSKPINDSDLAAIKSNINPNAEFQSISIASDVKVNWFDAIEIIFNQIREAKSEIILLSGKLDLDLVGLLDELTDSQITVYPTKTNKDAITDIKEWDFKAFFATVGKIQDYRSKLDSEEYDDDKRESEIRLFI